MIKRNHLLSSDADKRSAKLAPPYIGLYKVVVVLATNTYSLISKDGDLVDLVSAVKMKKYRASTPGESGRDEEDDDAQSPQDATSK